MKQVINGLVYNTETAEHIAGRSQYVPSDFNYVEESLYKTQNGRYFLAGEGGAMSKYHTQVEQNSWGPGAGIIPLTKSEALDWCETHNIGADIIEKEFAELLEEA